MEIPDYLHGIVSQNLNMETESISRRQFWAVVLGLPIKQDGDQFCILWGENLQTGVAGFGKTPVEAMYAFDTAMYQAAGGGGSGNVESGGKSPNVVFRDCSGGQP